MSWATRLADWDRRLDEPISVRPLALLRIAAGLLLLLHLRPFFELAADGITYTDQFYQPFWSWYPEIGGDAYVALLYGAGVAAVLVSVGLATRAAAIYAAVFVVYNVFLSETHYHHNRAFLIVLLIALAVLPVGRALSIDAHLARRRGTVRPPMGPRWPLTLLRFEIASVYLASGVSKLFDPDWWGGTVTLIRVERTADRVLDAGVPEAVLDVLLLSGFHTWAAKIIVLTELFIGGGLLWRRTRLAALWVLVPFHLAIEVTANVQVFSFAALAATVVWVTPVTRDRTVVVRGSSPAARLTRTWLPRLDWLARFSIEAGDGDGPAITLIDRPAADGAAVVRTGREAAVVILSRLPLTFWAAAPLLLFLPTRQPSARPLASAG